MRRALLALAVLLSLATPAFALGPPKLSEGGQFETATVVGVVKDSTGAVVPGAKVTLTNTQTGVTAERTSDANGNYEFFNVRIGAYLIAAEKAGFSVALVDNVNVTVGARQRVDLSMAVGQLSERVEVSARAVQLQTDSSDRSQIITADQTRALPLNGRAYSSLTLLSPGARQSSIGASREGSFNINGLRSTFNNFLIDGVDNNAYGTSNQGYSNQVMQPAPDAVGEIKVVTNNMSAEYGRSAGATVNVAYASGTNTIRGSAWEFARRTEFNATGAFRPANGIKPAFDRDQYGAVLGGPILKNKAFFFTDFEILKQTRGGNVFASLPTMTQRQGILAVDIRNPLTGEMTQQITGLSELGRQATNPQWQYPTVLNPKINYSWLSGRHSLKTGYEFQNIQTQVQDVNPLYGRDSYAGQFSRPAGVAANNLYNLGDFMLGLRSTYALSNILVADLVQNMHFLYIQDDWRVNDRLTLNAGLRYEYATPWIEENNVLSNFDPATKTMVPAKDGSLKDRSTVDPDRNNFGPRVGMAYTLTPTTVIRGGWGVSYVHFHRAGGGNVLPINGPQVINAVVVQTATQTNFRTTQQGYPEGLTDPSRFNPLAANITYMPSDYRSSQVQSWFASVQRELWPGALLDVAYVGNRAEGLLLFANHNQATPNNAAGTLTLQQRRPIQEYADITYAFNGGKSAYKSLQTKFNWRLNAGFSILSSLTLSESKDNGAGSLENANGNFPAPQDFRNMDADYGLSAYHQPYNSTTSFVIDLPFGRDRKWMSDANGFVNAVLGGWQIAGINTVIPGEQVTLTYTPSAAAQVSGIQQDFRGANNYRPNVSGEVLVPEGERTIGNRSAAAFGTITSTYDPRIIQLGLKVNF
ncbi:MAG: TonB-dependent receptor [Acidobacteriota bacterium]|nr:TonB-dependent receptor [Acidobacteriota bacterium]